MEQKLKNKVFFIILLFSSSFSFGQMNSHLKLFDSYSSAVIRLDNSIKIKNADFSIDTLKNLIVIHKIKGKYLEITLRNYKVYSEKINLKKYKKDTLSRQLTPVKSVLNSRYQEIWFSDNLSADTLTFENTETFRAHIFSYLKYLTFYLNTLDEPCDNGLCSYSNTYRYKILFSKNGEYYEINRIDKLQPIGYTCVELEKHLDKLKVIYPKLNIKGLEEKSDNMSISFMIRQ